MPEGHVIHSQARRLGQAFGRTAVAVDSPQGRFEDAAELINGRTMLGAEAHGKHLFLGFDNENWVHVHLGLFGKWRLGKSPEPEVSGQIRMRLRNQTHYAELRGPTACEVVTAQERDDILTRIGPDPIRADADPMRAWDRVQRSKVAVGAILMDQRVFAGVGNIYRAEALFRHNISPFRPGVKVTWSEFEGMWEDLVVLMTQGTKRGRIDTVRAEHLPDVTGRPARRDRHGGEVYVYRRDGKPCLVCATPIAATVMQGRNLFWCPFCQQD